MSHLILEGAGVQSFVSWADPQGNPIASINRDGTISFVGVRLQSDVQGVGASAAQLTGVVPVISSSTDVTNTAAPQSISHNAGPSPLHQIVIAANSRGNGAAGTTINFSLQFTNPQGTVVTLTNNNFMQGPGNGTLRGNVVDTASCTFNILIQVGTAIVLSTSFGTTVFNYDLSLRIIEIPVSITTT